MIRRKLRTKSTKKSLHKMQASDYSSMVLSIDSCLSRKNLCNIFKSLFKDENRISVYCSKLDEYLSNISRLTFDAIDDDIARILRLYVLYTYNDSDSTYTNVFLNYIRNTHRANFFKVNYISTSSSKVSNKKNLIFSFDNDIFRKTTNISDEWFCYESAFRHQFILLLTLLIIMEVDGSLGKLSNKLYEQFNLVGAVNRCAEMTVLTNMSASTEFITKNNYSELYYDIQNMPITNDKDIFIKINKEKQIIEVDILNGSFLSEEYSNYLNALVTSDIGKKVYTTLSDEPYIIKKSDVRQFGFDEYLDKKNISKIRFMKGETDKSLIVNIDLVGMRILSRIVLQSANPNDYLMADGLHESFYIPDDMTACLIWRIFNKVLEHSFENITKTEYRAYNSFISKSDYQRQLVKKTCVAILLSQYSKKEEKRLIDKYFSINDTKQKAELRADVNKVKKLRRQSKKSKSALANLLEGAYEDYVW